MLDGGQVIGARGLGLSGEAAQLVAAAAHIDLGTPARPISADAPMRALLVAVPGHRRCNSCMRHLTYDAITGSDFTDILYLSNLNLHRWVESERYEDGALAP